MLKITWIFILMILCFGEIHSQTNILNAGGDASSNGGSVSYSVGQLVYSQNIGSDGTVSEGLQHPYEILVISSIINRTNTLGIELSAYPNPTNDYLTLVIEEVEEYKMRYQIYDVTGRIIEDNNITESMFSINMTNFIPGVYYLKIILDRSDIVKTFKIIKK